MEIQCQSYVSLKRRESRKKKKKCVHVEIIGGTKNVQKINDSHHYVKRPSRYVRAERITNGLECRLSLIVENEVSSFPKGLNKSDSILR